MSERRFFQIVQRPSKEMPPVRGDTPLTRHRLPFTRRHLLKWRWRLNPKTLQQEGYLAEKKPLWGQLP